MSRKICFAGPSGIGKTTLCKYLDEKIEEPWKSTSAGDILNKQEKEVLRKEFGYSAQGHKNVINLSSKEPDFGKVFQNMVLRARNRQLETSEGIILDRSPLDNLVYMLTQASHNMSEDEVFRFITEARWAWEKLDYVFIILHSDDVPGVEDNNSRVPNRYFQKYISDVFRGTYFKYLQDIQGPIVNIIDFWDLKARKEFLNNTLEQGTQQVIDFEYKKI
jgi:adenylate kinase family enzyme